MVYSYFSTNDDIAAIAAAKDSQGKHPHQEEELQAFIALK